MSELVMPKMGDAMEEGTIVRWLKNEGDAVAEQEPIAEIETEKSNIEIPATDAGVIARFLVQPGETVAVGTPIAALEAAGARAPSPQAPPAPAPPEEPAAAAPAPQAGTPPAGEAPLPGPPEREPGPVPDGGRVKASPLARKVAREYGVDLGEVRGTGPGGRIIEADVEAALSRAPGPAPEAEPSPAAAPTPAAAPAEAAAPAGAAPGGTVRPLSAMRRAIARRLTESKQTIPHFYLTLEVDMRAAVRQRAEYNAAVGEERRVSFNDLVVRAAVLALEQYPALNSRLEGESIRTPAAIHMGIAVSLDEGLIVPVIRDAGEKSVAAIGRESRDLAARARGGRLKPEEYRGSTFTVSNLGMYDIAAFQAVINPPEAAILAVGAVRETPIVDAGEVVPGRQMALTVSVDHRIVDGTVAARFLQEIRRLLETPITLFG